MNTLPIGAPGELYIAGKGVAQGYLNNPNLTQKKFIRNKFYRQNLYVVENLPGLC